MEGLRARWTYRAGPYPPLKARAKASSGQPGFFFWSAVINPLEDSFLIWDSAANSVQCRYMSSLEMKWEIKVPSSYNTLNAF